MTQAASMLSVAAIGVSLANVALTLTAAWIRKACARSETWRALVAADAEWRRLGAAAQRVAIQEWMADHPPIADLDPFERAYGCLIRLLAAAEAAGRPTPRAGLAAFVETVSLAVAISQRTDRWAQRHRQSAGPRAQGSSHG